jgi:putative (di)nucleoside polyphosphate hydrolase|tara:strand:- start:110 stop:568 length:459 start_codon:yes stop_codon:yes gene_type:complete
MKNLRKGVGIFLMNKDNQLWVGKRIDFKNNYWQMPQGGIDENETPEEAMKRELSEEVGINKNFEIVMTHGEWLSYYLPSSIKNKVWDGKFIGQTQKWFACKFHGKDSDFKLDTHTPEFSDWKWVNPSEILELVVPFKRQLYKGVLDGFRKLY